MLALGGVLAAALMVVGGVIAVTALRNPPSAVLLVGTVLGLCNSSGWLIVPYLMNNGTIAPGEMAFLVLRLLSAISYLLTAVGLVLTVVVVVGMRRRNEELERIIEGSRAANTA